MQTKLLEVRDHGTLIPALAVRLEPETERQRQLLAWAGYTRSPHYILLVMIGGKGIATTDPFSWPQEPLRSVHYWLQSHFEELPPCAVVDARVCRGEEKAAAPSDLQTQPAEDFDLGTVLL